MTAEDWVFVGLMSFLGIAWVLLALLVAYNVYLQWQDD